MKNILKLFLLCLTTSACAGQKPDLPKLESRRDNFLSTGVAGHPGAIAAALQMKWNRQDDERNTTAPSASQTTPSNPQVKTPQEKQRPTVAQKTYGFEFVKSDGPSDTSPAPLTWSAWFWKKLGY